MERRGWHPPHPSCLYHSRQISIKLKVYISRFIQVWKSVLINFFLIKLTPLEILIIWKIALWALSCTILARISWNLYHRFISATSLTNLKFGAVCVISSKIWLFRMCYMCFRRKLYYILSFVNVNCSFYCRKLSLPGDV